MPNEEFGLQVADALDRRRLEITRIKQVVLVAKETLYEATATSMAIPALYAHWEGFVKEALTLYLEYVEARGLTPVQANPSIFAFSLREHARRLQGNQSIERLREFATWTLEAISSPIVFRNKQLETRSNLRFEVLEDLCEYLGIDTCEMQHCKIKLDSLVHRRNNLSHGGRQEKISIATIEDYALFVIDIMEALESILLRSVESKSFKRM